MKRALYVGSPGFPKGFAQVQRQLLISKGLVEKDCSVLAISRYGVHNVNTDRDVKIKGNFEGIDYIYCSGTPFRNENYFIRNLLKIKGFFLEFRTLLVQRVKHKAKILLISTNTFNGIAYYTLVSKLLNMTSVVDMVEYWTAHDARKNKFYAKLNDKYYGYLTDKAIVISDFLKDNLQKERPNKAVIKIPAVCNFSKFDNVHTFPNGSPYFLFCGSVNYFEVIKFVIDAYHQIKSTVGLKLIISGNQKHINRVALYISENKVQNVTIKSNIPYQELVESYKKSLALLIPLRPSLQDIARFPHKLGEYTASKRPIVSTEIGEVKTYFQDGVNAFLSASYDVELYSQKMKQVIESVAKREKIAVLSYALGQQEFDYKKNGDKLYNFLFNPDKN